MRNHQDNPTPSSKSRPGGYQTVLLTVLFLAGAAGIWRFNRMADPDNSLQVAEDIPGSVEVPTSGEFPVSQSANAPEAAPPAQRSSFELVEILNLQTPLLTREREELLQQLNPRLTIADVIQLFGFFESPSPVDNTLWNPDRVYELKNNLLNVLLRQGDPGGWQLGEKLIALSLNKNADLVMRDYALQHLADMVLAGNPNAGDFAHHVRMLEDEQLQLVATAMLHLLAAESQQVLNSEQRSILAKRAYELAADSQTNVAFRATALQVAGRLQVPGLDSLALQVSGNEHESIFLRIAAIASLGDMSSSHANTDVIQFLNQTAQGREPRLRIPALSALQRLQTKSSPTTL